MNSRVYVSLALLAAMLLPSAVAPAKAPPAKASAKPVGVTLVEMKIKLSRAAVSRGTVVFAVVNRGKIPHDFDINGRKTPLLRSGQRATLKVTFSKRGRYPYICTVPGHAAAGMRGTLTVG